MRYITILIILNLGFQALLGQNLYINGKFVPSPIDTIRQNKDTLWIKTTCCETNDFRYTTFLNGYSYSQIRRPWYTLPLLNIDIFPKARYREEGIIVNNSKRLIKGTITDSIIFSRHGLRDSVKNSNGKLLWKRNFEKFSIGPCDVHVFVIRQTFLRDERKKKHKQRKK